MDGSRGALTVALLVALTIASASASATATAAEPATDRTVTRIAVAENGTATWQVGIWTRLPTDESVADYERFQRRFRENTSQYLDPFRRNIEGIVADAAAETGREMRATDFRASTRVQAVPRRWGIVTYRFEWTGFAASDGSALVVGDVFRGDFYLTGNDTLAIVGPRSHEVAAVAPPPADRERNRVRWFGRRTFADDRPRVRFEPRPTPSPTASRTGASTARSTSTDGADGAGGADGYGTGEAGTGTDPATPADGDGGGPPAALLAVAAATVVVLGAGTYRVLTTRADGGPPPRGPDRDTSPAESPSTVPADADSGSRSAVDSPDSTADASGTATDAGAATGGGSEPMLTDEDRVRQLLEDNDGRLRQSDVVDSLDWSKSKTSRILSGMAEEGTVEKLRIGRENVISLQDDDGSDGADEDRSSGN